MAKGSLVSRGWLLLCLVIGTLLMGCGLLPGSGGSKVAQAGMIAAVRARWSAWSRGIDAGDPAEAASLSTGQAATDNRFAAADIQGRRASGDTSDYGFDVLALSAYPLDGGTRYFLAFVKGRTHDTGEVFSEVELYERTSGPWKALEAVSVAANLDPPRLQLNGHGEGHILSAQQSRAMNADPTDIAQRYAAFATQGARSGKPAPGAFRAGPFTSGTVRSEAGLLESLSGRGTAQFDWVAGTDGESVALQSGTLVFAHVTETTSEQRGRSGTTQSFFVQDQQRMNWGGLLAPGDYSSLTILHSDTVAVEVPQQGLPDVVAESDAVTSLTGTPVGGEPG